MKARNPELSIALLFDEKYQRVEALLQVQTRIDGESVTLTSDIILINIPIFYFYQFLIFFNENYTIEIVSARRFF